MVRLWWGRVTADAVDDDGALALAEREHLGRIRHAPTRAAQRASYAMRRAVLGRLGGVAPQDVVFRRRCGVCGSEEHGRPEVIVPAVPEVRSISITHTRSTVGLATSTAAVGLDIEQPRSAVEWEEISDLTAHPADDAPTPLHAWTAKEAVLKLLGMGLSQPMRHVRVADGAWHLDGHVGRLHWEDLDGCALGAIATHGPATTRVIRWPMETDCAGDSRAGLR